MAAVDGLSAGVKTAQKGKADGAAEAFENAVDTAGRQAGRHGEDDTRKQTARPTADPEIMRTGPRSSGNDTSSKDIDFEITFSPNEGAGDDAAADKSEMRDNGKAAPTVSRGDGSLLESLAARRDAENAPQDTKSLTNIVQVPPASGEALLSVKAGFGEPSTDRAPRTAEELVRNWRAAMQFATSRPASTAENPAASLTSGAAGPNAPPVHETDKLFRFARHAEAEKPVELSIADDAALLKRTVAEVTARAGDSDALQLERPSRDFAPKPEIAILEQRKYLGVAAAHTAVASVISAVTENAEWNSMLRDAASTAAVSLNGARNASNSMKIQLSPAELGTVTATFRMSGGNLSIELRVETIEAYRQLSDDQNAIVRALKGHGYDVDQVVVQHVGGERSVGTTTGAGTNAAAAQSGDTGNGNASANGDQDGRGRSTRHGDENANGFKSSAENLDRGGDDGHARGVYL